MPGLRGIRKTAPYFHNNSAGTLEEVVDHYIAFSTRAKVTAPPGVVPLRSAAHAARARAFARVPAKPVDAASQALLLELSVRGEQRSRFPSRYSFDRRWRESKGNRTLTSSITTRAS